MDVVEVKTVAEAAEDERNKRLEAVRRAPRTQMSFSNIPVPIREAFEAKASELGIRKKDFFYHCMKVAGVDIPDYKDLDARKNRAVGL